MTDEREAGSTSRRPVPTEDVGGGVGARAMGCVLALAVFGILLSAPDILGIAPPPLLLAILSVVAGVGCLTLYSRVALRRWGVTTPDAVQLLERDLGAARRLRRGRLPDYRLQLGKEWPLRERLLHELLYATKWLGHLLVFAGAGWVIYRIMVFSGLAT